MLTKKELADECKISTRTIDRYMTQGLPYYKAQGKRSAVRFKLEEVEGWMKGE